MLVYGTGQGYRTFAETQNGTLFAFCALRPPHNATGFSRTFGSSNWKPLPFGIEGPWNLTISNDKNELSSSQISATQSHSFSPVNAIVFSRDATASVQIILPISNIYNATIVPTSDQIVISLKYTVTPINAGLYLYAQDPPINQIHSVSNMNALMYMMADSGGMIQTHRVTPSDSYISVTGIGESLFQGQFIFPMNSSIFSSDNGQAVSQIHNLRSADSYILVTGTLGEVNQIYFVRCINSVSFLSNSIIDLSQVYRIIPSAAYIESNDSIFSISVSLPILYIYPVDAQIDLSDNLKYVFLSPWINTGRSGSKSRTYKFKLRRIDESLISDHSRNIKYQTKRKSMDANIHHSRQGDKRWQNPVRRKSY